MPRHVAKCPLCGWDAETESVGGRDASAFRCGTCGNFEATRSFLAMVRGGGDQELMPFLSAHVRQETERGIRVVLHTDNWRDLARAHAHTPVSRKLEMLLEHLGRCSRFPGDPATIDYQTDYPLFDAVSDKEVEFLVGHLIQRGLLKAVPNGLQLSAEGWARLEPTVSGGIEGRCFVAMSFDPSLQEAYDLGIRRAIEDDCKLTAVRVDRMEHNEKICDRIVAEIKKAQFVVADFTLHRQGVYFEAGYAMALGRPVIWMCREDNLAATHFDTRQYNHIAWTTPAELRTRLADRIRATILR